MLRHVLAIALVTCASMFSSAAAGQSCVKDMDCPGEAICEAGRCVGDGGKPVSSGSPVATSAGGAGLVKVEFIPRGKPVLVMDADTTKSCMAPCSLEMPPGKREIRINSKHYRWSITVPPGGGKFTVASRSSGTIALGVVALAVGGGAALLGHLARLAEDNEEVHGVGTKVLIGGGALAVLGVILLVLAEWGRPLEAVGPRRRRVAQRPLVLPYAAPRPGGGTVGLAFSF